MMSNPYQKPWLISAALLAAWPDPVDAVADQVGASAGAVQAYLATGAGLSASQMNALADLLSIRVDELGDVVAQGSYLLRPTTAAQVRDLWRLVHFETDLAYAYELQGPQPDASSHIVAFTDRQGVSVMLIPRIRDQLTNDYLLAMPGLSQELVPMASEYSQIMSTLDLARDHAHRSRALGELGKCIDRIVELHELGV